MHTFHVQHKVIHSILVGSEGKNAHAGPKNVKRVIIAILEIVDQVVQRERNRRNNIEIKQYCMKLRSHYAVYETLCKLCALWPEVGEH